MSVKLFHVQIVTTFEQKRKQVKHQKRVNKKQTTTVYWSRISISFIKCKRLTIKHVYIIILVIYEDKR